ncbi:MAG TPA: hypothetical protein VGW77_15470 [Candidatus Binatia bacterium]|nr:hypothetical protein [Candidatus Binatia bacterium]
MIRNGVLGVASLHRSYKDVFTLSHVVGEGWGEGPTGASPKTTDIDMGNPSYGLDV